PRSGRGGRITCITTAPTPARDHNNQTMPIIVACPTCNGQLRVADDLIRRKVRCPACNATFEAIPPRERPDEPPQPLAPLSPSPPAPPPPASPPPRGGGPPPPRRAGACRGGCRWPPRARPPRAPARAARRG